MITFEELLERAKSELIAIHTPTEEQAKTLLKALDEKGYEWSSGRTLTTKTCYEDYKEKTCYYLLDKKIMYCSLDWYQRHDYTIIEFEDIDLEEERRKSAIIRKGYNYK